MANKIKYGISNVHYAVLGTSGYETPVALPGAVSISLSAEGDRNVFYADNIEYFVTNTNNGYSGTLEVALLDDDFREAILGEILDSSDKTLMEVSSGAESIKFALGFDIEGDNSTTKFWFYNCTASRPEASSSTKNESIEPNTDSIEIKCTPDANGKVRVKTTEATTSTVVNGWYTAVYTG